MKKTKSVIWILACLPLVLSSFVHAGIIRTVNVNEHRMQTINLKMGQSTVLRFREKPKKVIVGNSNYYNVEFIENDLTIQPQEKVTTNLFVYGEFHVYGFLLRTCSNCTYDDLVNVRWKSQRQYKARPRDKVVKNSAVEVNKKFSVGDVLVVELIKVVKSSASNFYVLDIIIGNLTNSKIKTEDIKVMMARGGKQLKNQKYIFNVSQIDKGQSAKVRCFIKLTETKGFTVKITFMGKIGKEIISRKLLY